MAKTQTEPKRRLVTLKAAPGKAKPAPTPKKPKTKLVAKVVAKIKAVATKSDASAEAKPAKKPRPLKPKAPPPQVFALLHAHHSDAHCELDHKNPFQLIIATVLSAQSTDVMVNKLTPDLFARFPTPEKLAKADPAQVEQMLSRIGMFRQKTKNIIGLAQQLVEKHGGKVPQTLAELVKLPGVGRKTANVVLGVAFNAPEGVVVDTHVQRLTQRLGWTKHTEPVDIEQDLMRTFDKKDWDMISHVLIFHGRRICTAMRPACSACPVSEYCPAAFKAENIGRKPPRVRA
jgi:endonuclease-3